MRRICEGNDALGFEARVDLLALLFSRLRGLFTFTDPDSDSDVESASGYVNKP